MLQRGCSCALRPSRAAARAIGPLGIGFIFEGGLTFDAAGRLTGVDQGDAATATTFEINTATGAATIIGPPGGQARDINGLTRDGTVVYGIDRPSNSLGRLDVVTGSYTQVGLTGAAIGDTGGLAFDEVTGTLYATFAADGGFYRIDPATGTATLIAVNRVDYGLAFAPHDKPGKLLTHSVKFVCGVQQSQEPAQAVVRPGRRFGTQPTGPPERYGRPQRSRVQLGGSRAELITMGYGRTTGAPAVAVAVKIAGWAMICSFRKTSWYLMGS